MWRLWLGLVALVGFNLAANLGVVLALQTYFPLFVFRTGFQVLLQVASMQEIAQFGLALFCLCYQRLAAPWPQIGCSIWVALAALLHNSVPGLPNPEIVLKVIFAITSLWTGYGLFILGRWHFGMEFAKEPAAPTRRVRILTPPALFNWSAILLVAMIGRLFLANIPRVESVMPDPDWSVLLWYAFLHALFVFPLFAAMLLKRWAWTLSGVIVGTFISISVADVIHIAVDNPPFAYQRLTEHCITLAIFLANAIALRALGLRWQAAEPWPAKARPQFQTTPNPFA